MKSIIFLMMLLLYGCVNPFDLKQGDCITFYEGRFPKYIDVVVKVDGENYTLLTEPNGEVIGGSLDKMKPMDYVVNRKVSCQKQLIFSDYEVRDMRNQGTLVYIVDMIKETKKDWKLED